MTEQNYAKSFDMSSKVALITGAAGGLGAEIAHAFAHSGASVVITDINKEAGEATVKALRESGAAALFLPLNVTDEGQWESAIAETINHFGGIDVLVNNAGAERLSYINDCTLEMFRFIMDVNLVGTFLGVKHAVRAMQPGGTSGRGGSIVNLSSAAALKGVTALSAYCAAKGGVTMLTKAAAVECAQLHKGIRVNSVHPGVVKTDMAMQFMQQYVDLGVFKDEADAMKKWAHAHPIGRLGKPSDIAHAVLYLASDVSSWVTGTQMVVDGGLTAT